MPRSGISILTAIAVLSLFPAQADQLWRPNANEVYGPQTYCNWNRTGLPEAQQRICIERDRRNPPKNYQATKGEALATLLPHCDPSGGLSCNDDIFQKVWLRLEADNGEVTKIDMNSLQRSTVGSVEAITYTYVPNTAFDQTKLRRLLFDCKGHFMDITNSNSELLDAPPRSVVGNVASIVCSHAR